MVSDDIVSYLRLSRTRFNRHAEAADEIERLRAERDKWKGWAQEYVFPDCECSMCNEIAAAADGDR